jgi:hypothetical protein
MWEIFMEKEPFKGLGIKELSKTVAEDNTRPKI